jgi:hypothetical protein
VGGGREVGEVRLQTLVLLEMKSTIKVLIVDFFIDATLNDRPALRGRVIERTHQSE